jgi:glycosyltransferase involved in cell wall biosynthesis
VSLNLEDEFIEDVEELVDKIPEPIGSIGILVSRLDESEGAGNVAIRQCRALRDSQYSPAIFTFEAETKFSNIEIKEVGKNSYLGDTGTRLLHAFSPINIIRFAQNLRSFDLLIVHQPVLCPAAFVAKYLYGVITIYYNHHITKPGEKPGIVGKFFGYTAYRAILHSSSKLDGVVSVSEYSRDEYAAKFGKKGPVIYNKIDEASYHNAVEGDSIRRKFGIDDQPVILYVGRLARSKRVHELIDVYNEILDTYPNAVLLIVGRKDENSYVERLIGKKEVSNGRIIFTGIVPESELPSYYAAADVYATCSEKEGYNLTIAEAEACGTPTVAYDIGAHSEVQTNGDLVKFGDTGAFATKIIDLLSN